MFNGFSSIENYDQLPEGLIPDMGWAGRSVFIKPNLVTPCTTCDKASCTDVRVVSRIIERLKDFGASRIVVGDCGFRHQWELTMASAGYNKLPARYGVEVVGLQEKENYNKFKLIRFPTKSDYLSLFGAKFSEFFLDCEMAVNIPKLKIHSLAGVTGAIKNMMGCMTNKGNMHPRGNAEILHRRLRDLYFLIRDRVSYVVMDGIIGSEYSEQFGIPRWAGVILRGKDMWEVDVEAAKVMGISPGRIGYLDYIRGDLCREFHSIIIPPEIVQHFTQYIGW